MTDLKQNTFKYNMSFYYQSTITYLVIFVIYLVIRALYEDTEVPMGRDPIIYFFAIIVLVAVASLIYNLYLNRHLKVNNEGVQYIDRFKTRTLKTEDIALIRLGHESGRFRKIASRLIRIKLKNKRRLLLIRPNDYENVGDLLNAFRELKKKVEESNV